jgi:hypothetical protein
MVKLLMQLLLEHSNLEGKKHLKYSNTNPPYLEEDAARFIRGGIKHLLIDCQVLDKEKRLLKWRDLECYDVNNLNADARFGLRR